MRNSNKANSTQISEVFMCSSSKGRKNFAPVRVYVDEAITDDDSVVSLSLETMDRLHLSPGEPVWIKGKKCKQTISIAIHYDTCHDDEPKIRLNTVAKKDLWARVGDFVSVHRCPNFKYAKPLSSTDDDDNLTLTVAKKDLWARIGNFFSAHRCPDVKYVKPLSSTDNDDNLILSKFLDNAPDRILFEIFLRLPNLQSALQYSCVCKRWYSIIYNSVFLRGFTQIHLCPQFFEDYDCSQPFSLLFARWDRYLQNGDIGDDPDYFEPFCTVFSEKSKVPDGKIPSRYLDFLPYPVKILASFDDLVVVASLKHTILRRPEWDCARFTGPRKNYICNLFTKQWVELPDVTPPFSICGYGFIREPISCYKQHRCANKARYRVVMIGRALPDPNMDRAVIRCKDNEFAAKVLCSESGQWSEFVISYPHHQTVVSEKKQDLVVVASNGILYWLEGVPYKGIVAFDPFNDIHTRQCRFIRLPAVCFKNTYWSNAYEKVCLGVVNEKLRLSQLYKAQAYFAFKVWELKNHNTNSPSWILVYNLKLDSPEKHLFMLSFHPNNTNVVFLLRGNDICQYEISEKKYEKVGEYPDEIYDDALFYMETFSLVHPSWPTILPHLSS